MPNWVMCRFQNISDMEKFKSVAVNPATGNIDFGILLPMPETLNITAPPQGKQPDGFTFPEITGHIQLDRYLQKCVDKECSVSQALAHWNKVKYGTTDWYSWNIGHWGTKWNACDSCTDSDTPEFQTAWSMPEGWLRELAEHVDFTLVYADEDMGCNCGRVIAFNGDFNWETPENEAEALALAYHIWYGDAAEETMQEFLQENPDDETHQDALQNFNNYINNWI